MSRGPLPDPNARRRNAPTIPTTNLPASGRATPAPECPVELAAPGAAWWEWAWHTPQAAAWSAGDLYTVARRAQLEDDLAVLDTFDSADDLLDLLGLDVEYEDIAKQITWIMKKLRGIAGNRVSVSKAATDIDDRLGLTPKGMAALRWKIVVDSEPEDAGRKKKTDEVSERRARRRQAVS